MNTIWGKPPKIIVFTGGALAREAGFAPFDPATMPAGLRLEDVVTRDGFARDPDRVNDFYNKRRRELLRCEAERGARRARRAGDAAPARGADRHAQHRRSARARRVEGGHPHARRIAEGALH